MIGSLERATQGSRKEKRTRTRSDERHSCDAVFRARENPLDDRRVTANQDDLRYIIDAPVRVFGSFLLVMFARFLEQRQEGRRGKVGA